MRRLLAVPLVLACAGCALKTAASLQDAGVRVELSGRLMATLDEQDHYFGGPLERGAFEQRLRRIAEDTSDATTYYSALSDALAELGEGHTGLVGSAEVPFSATIPPVALLEADEQFVVAGVSPGVEGGGLRPGDVLLEIDALPAHRVVEARLRVTSGSTAHGRRARAVANLLAGPTDEPAVVRVRGADGRERTCFPLRFLLEDQGVYRFRFGFLPQTVLALRLTPSAGYVALPDFQPERRDEFEEAVAVFTALPELVLDLRGNPGGRIRTLQRIAGIFVDEPEDLLLLRENGRMRPLRAVPGPVRYRGRLSILVDERTGSASELLAAALRDLGRATVFGRPTAGSARSRLTSILPGGVVFHYAGSSEFLRRDGRPIEGHGIEPDVFYRPSREDLSRGAYGDPRLDPLVRLALGRN